VKSAANSDLNLTVNNAKAFIDRARNGEVTRDEILSRLYMAVLITLAVAVALTRRAASAVVTYSPQVRRTTTAVLERLVSVLKTEEAVV